MKNSREILRKSHQQNDIENKEFVIDSFLNQKNIDWIDKILLDTNFLSTGNSLVLQEILNDKLQSKVEYKFINCYPVFYDIINIQNQITNNEFSVFSPITNELVQNSIVLLCPLDGNHKDFHIDLITHISNDLYPRENSFRFDFKKSNLGKDNFRKIELKQGEAIIFFNNTPFSIISKIPIRFLKIEIIPYESEIILHDKSSEKNEIKLYKVNQNIYVNFKLKIENIDSISKKARKLTPLENIDLKYENIYPTKKNTLFQKIVAAINNIK